MILAMVENNAAERMIDAVVDVVAGFAVPHGFANDPGDGSGRGRDQEPAGLSKDLDVFGEQTVNLCIDFLCQGAERLDVAVVRRREPAANIEDFDFPAARLSLAEDGGGNLEGLDKVLEI